MRIVNRESLIRILELESLKDTISNKKLERSYLEHSGKVVVIGSLCPVLKDRLSYNIMVSQTELDQKFINAITWLPDELLPKFIMRNPGTKQLSIEGSYFYMFIKKTATGNYNNLSQEKQMKLLEQSRVLRTNIEGDTVEENMVIVFPPNTKYIPDSFLEVFTKQKEPSNITIVKKAQIHKSIRVEKDET